ncbi:type I 3-dehydroquinate dehydratase [Halalkalicoccus jeotgali]|uniref:3-dehydroquinate dehydratase n=1 Tax=Halalkalicoccus jeotgali (strain DSM 18796 / CECT 7217 / JCM 14584 / KCTC 4019 / B3) TaxID=795797 RepID=D8J7J9_HALJB|nr:type I 3-dehydroquinate dehydratase [Halalkalicoccus jeotgali]ADJ16019.1 3-dehydroquinate dehydratase [Halalkalicoccus jeotgali B3]ELY38115.1 3-dehydroquinate dehydratase [Halalkalicoccus jeotgali B3]
MSLEFDSFTLAAATADLSEEPRAREHADCVEFRMDLATESLTALASYTGELPIVATNRTDREGGAGGEESDERRLDDLARAAEFDSVGAIDIELAALESGAAETTAAHARDHGASVIASAHDFEGIPDTDGMRELLDRATEHGEVGKLAVSATDPGDVLALLSVTDELAGEGKRVATMAMGEAGRHSRAVAPIYGSRIGYAPVDPANATAPGQYDLATLRELVERLR